MIGVGGSCVPPLAAGFHPTAGIHRPDLSLPYVANVSLSISNFKWYISNFYMDVAKVDRDIAHVASVFRGMLQVFVEKCFICFQSYVAASVFMLQLPSVLCGCCISFTLML
jgi:hypothetical protein